MGSSCTHAAVSAQKFEHRNSSCGCCWGPVILPCTVIASKVHKHILLICHVLAGAHQAAMPVHCSAYQSHLFIAMVLLLLLQVRIFSPARTAGQQGQGNTIFAKARPWRIAFDTQQK
jgi:hypothetical protein